MTLETSQGSKLEVALESVHQRNWSRVARGRVQGGATCDVFVKQFHTRRGEWAEKAFANELRAISEYGRWGVAEPLVINAIGADAGALAAVFPFHDMMTAERAYDRRNPTQFIRFLGQIETPVGELLSRVDPQAGRRVQLPDRPPMSLKGADVRNLGVRHWNSGTPETLIFDLGHAYRAESGDLAAKYLVSILMMNWGANPITCLHRVPSGIRDRLQFLACRTTYQRVQVEIDKQMSSRARYLQAGSALGRAVKRLGFQTLGRWYKLGMARSAREIFNHVI